MSLYGAFAQANHFSEFADPIDKGNGVILTSAQRKAEALVNLGVTPSAAVVGGATNYKITRSAAPVALDGSGATSVAHGLGTCVAAFVQQVGSAAPGDSTSCLTVVINGANLDVYPWKNVSGTDPTLVASDGTETFSWFAIGTAA